jgi:hypothetical protein
MAEKLRIMPKRRRKGLKRTPTKIMASSASPIPGKGLFTRDTRLVSVTGGRGKVAVKKRFEAQKAGAPGPVLSGEQKGVIKRMDAQIARDQRVQSLKKRAGTTVYGRAAKKQREEHKRAKTRKSSRKSGRH